MEDRKRDTNLEITPYARRASPLHFIWEFVTFHALLNNPEFSFTTGTCKRYLRIIPQRSRQNT